MTTPGSSSIVNRPRLRANEFISNASDTPRSSGLWTWMASTTFGSWTNPRDSKPDGADDDLVRSRASDSQTPTTDATPTEVAPPLHAAGDRSGPSAPSPRAQAAAELYALTRLESISDEAWLHTAEVFRRTFKKLRQTEPRHADLAQVVSDAFRFTARERLSANDSAMEPLRRAGDALLDSFIPTETELEIQKDLLARGWKLTRPYSARSLAH